MFVQKACAIEERYEIHSYFNTWKTKEM
uniref:Uncharacterized protein n=1 Tax=Arundo donax TaxID=35708 RepID=A0A0A8YPV3_ARUDO